MYLALLVSIAAGNPVADVRRVADDFTLTTALDRSQSLAGQLLDALSDGPKTSTKTRVKTILDDCKRDRQRLAREGKNPIFEAGILMHYGELCQLAQENLGPESLKFKPHPVRGAKLDQIKFNGDRGQKTSFAETLFGPEELQAMGVLTHDLIDGLTKKEKPDTFLNAKWKKDVAQFRKDVKRAQEDLISNMNISKVPYEARLLALYAKAVSLTVNFDK